MIPPRYRTLDGDEVALPLAMGSWVLVPRGLARFDPELAWTLDYDDAPEPEDADPRLDFSDGALLVPVERWNERAELEPNLAPCFGAPGVSSSPQPPGRIPDTRSPNRGGGTDPESRRPPAAHALGGLWPALSTPVVSRPRRGRRARRLRTGGCAGRGSRGPSPGRS
jgi:hypothetical protein